MADKASGRGRWEFSPATREIVARRAAFTCSFPGCGKLTVGPASDPAKASNTGIAAHIYGAAKSGQGPRGARDLTKEDLQSQENAIWLCAHHANLIDKHEGADYPPDLLHSYKALHETRIARQHAGIHTPFGWVERVAIRSSPLLAEPAELHLAKLNLLIGGNSTGKTGLCQWIAGHFDPARLERWRPTRPDRRRLATELRYFDPDPHRVTVDFRSKDYPVYRLDGRVTVPSLPLVNVVFPQDLDFLDRPAQDTGEEPDDLRDIAAALNLHPYEVSALFDEMEELGDDFVAARFEQTDQGRFLLVEQDDARVAGPFYFGALSGSARARLIMRLGIETANRMSALAPTLLILDSSLWRLDTDWLSRYAAFLGSPLCKFQTVASTIRKDIDFGAIAWSGWKLFQLQGDPPDVTVTAGFDRSHCSS